MFFEKWFLPKPYNEGYLPEDNGHKVYFAEYGNKNGKPILIFHGGPGGSCRAKHIKGINLKKYRVIAVEQRGCNRSEPMGKIKNNTTKDLLNDYDRLINHLNINEKIILRGASWGSTLALLWAERNPDKVEKMLLSQIFLANKDFLNWEFDGIKNIYPDFVEYLNKKSKGNIKSYYNKLIQSVNKKNQLTAINEYGWFERICGSMNPKFAEFSDVCDKELASNRIYMHYADNNFFLKEEDDILKNINKIKDIEAVLIHNRLDLICPFKGAYDLHKKMKNSKLIVVDEFGHVGDKLHTTISKEFKKVLK